MPVITRDVVFGKLGEVSMKTLQGAFEFARLRGDAYIEPAHWLAVWLRTDNCDIGCAIARLGLAQEQVCEDVEAGLERLRRSRSSRLDFSGDLELVIERGWISASLMFGASRMRTGHLLHGMLNHPELRRLLRDLSPSLGGIEPEAFANRFGELTRGSIEEASETEAAIAPAGVVTAVKTEESASALERFTTDLTEQARSGKTDPVLGRDREIRELIDILMRRRQNNPIIVGEAGVGKTALVEGLALRVARGDVPAPLADIRILSLDLAGMQAGAAVRGEFENRLKQVISEVQQSSRPIVLFIDEAHTLIGAGGSAGTGDAANLLKPALARGTLRTIAATTWAEYKRHIEKDAALARRFQAVQVDQPEEEPAIRMLRGTAGVLAEAHKVDLRDEAIVAAVRFSRRYMQGRQLPDKAVSVLDTACARVAISLSATPPEIEDARRRIGDLETELSFTEREKQIGVSDPAREDRLRLELAQARDALQILETRHSAEKALVEQILELGDRLRSGQAPDGSMQQFSSWIEELRGLQGERPLILSAVDAQVVASVIEGWTGIPVGRILADEIDAVLRLKAKLGERVIGQDHALGAIAKRIETSRAGLEDPAKPKGVFLLVGPSGVGKTETALALAETLFGSEDHMITINMSEFQEAHTVSTLKGAPPGYVGYGEGGRLTEAVRHKPYSVVLLDEIEKAHPDVHQLFFQVFDKGLMEDGEGRRVDFKNTLIIMTSNVGSDLMMQLCADPDLMPTPDGIARAVRDPLLKVFPTAFLGRLSVVPYYPLSDDMLNRIIRLQLERVRRRIEYGRGVLFGYDEDVVSLIRDRCTEVESGGRMVDAILTGTLLPTMSREVLQRLRDGRPLSRVLVGVAQHDFAFTFE
jgi:type VI secretion system protein VasG